MSYLYVLFDDDVELLSIAMFNISKLQDSNDPKVG